MYPQKHDMWEGHSLEIHYTIIQLKKTYLSSD